MTDRQKTVLVGVLAGKSNKAIASDLRVKEQTVKNDMKRVFGHFGVSRTRELFPIIDRVRAEARPRT